MRRRQRVPFGHGLLGLHTLSISWRGRNGCVLSSPSRGGSADGNIFSFRRHGGIARRTCTGCVGYFTDVRAMMLDSNGGSRHDWDGLLVFGVSGVLGLM
ncbi:hypothetical protein NL676_028996 [Syzygium grande]|nr:hypothetical protein NL676_028996 [Syzygium grande]